MRRPADGSERVDEVYTFRVIAPAVRSGQVATIALAECDIRAMPTSHGRFVRVQVADPDGYRVEVYAH